MALTQNIEFKGIPVSNAYVRVLQTTLGMDKVSMIFSTQTSSRAGIEPLSNEVYSAPYDLEGANPFNQAYEYLKTLPEFEGSTDC